MNALLSVSDKTNLDYIARVLTQAGYTLISTGGTLAYLQARSIPVTSVASLTKMPELLGGRVKTLHPTIHAGILANRDSPADMKACADQGIGLISVVIVNLYPFESTVADPDVTNETAIEMIDCGGVAMIRSAAKNHKFVTVVTDPAAYPALAQALDHNALTQDFRRRLARAAFEHTSAYDAAIGQYLNSEHSENSENSGLPDSLTLTYKQVRSLRYGENAHQAAAVYANSRTTSGWASLKQHHGKQLSYNNLVDADAAWQLVRSLTGAACVIIKHTNPCGVAVKSTLEDAYTAAHAADPVSAFGSIIGFNQTVTAPVAMQMNQTFIEAVIAPGYTPEALAILQQKAMIRLIELPDFHTYQPDYDLKPIAGGMLYQTANTILYNTDKISIPTAQQIPESVWPDLTLAYTVVKHVKSNAIVLVDSGVVIGVGAGQMSRVEATQLALSRVRTGDITQAVAASDAFFPFPDSVTHLGKAGIRAIIQPGGSKQDPAVIQECNRYTIAMALTGIRQFKH